MKSLNTFPTIIGLFLLSIFFTTSDSLYAQELRFTKVDEYLASLPEHLKNEQTQEAKAVKILKSKDNAECTAAFISNAGHILTARHCMQKCLIRSGIFQMVYEQKAVSYFHLNQQKLGKAECSALLDGEPVDLIIESTSPGLIVSMDEKSLQSLNPQLFKNLVEQSYTSKGDFVIARVKNSSHSTSCIPLAKKPALTRDLVHNFAYPTATNRPDGWNSDGLSFYATTGEVISGIAKNSCVIDAKLSETQLRKLEKEFDEDTAFMSTLDAIYGSSGAPVISSNGEVVGILTNVYRPDFAKPHEEPKARYCSGSAKALRIEHILSIAHSQNASLLNLECNSKK